MATDQGRDLLLKGIKPILIEDELKSSFLDYAMSVVVSRAIPDVRDGLKPVHRRVLYAMHELGYYFNKPPRKSVRVVGDVMGKYHPHGDQAVYNTMVGMVQDFVKRYPLLDGQGNWGSVDGDNAAAMRYTEVRMQKISQEILADIDKNTVPFVPNFDDSTQEPVILPSRFPNLLVNGTAGIAVGMATSIPPHNLTEVIDGCLAFLKNDFITDEELMRIIPGPDFPTGGIICGRTGIIKGYKTGRGSVIVRAVTSIQETKKGSAIVVTELPYQVNKSELIIKIADMVKNKEIEGISNIRDESDKKGMRLVIEIKKGDVPDVILNQLFKHTSLQTSISILSLALLDNKPIVFTLRELLHQFLLHRETVVYKRTTYDIERARMRAHILEGFIIALTNIDDVIQLIKDSPAAEDAIIKLEKKYKLSQEQSKAVLEMRLQRLTGLEQEKIHSEINELKAKITYLASVLENREVLKQEIVQELIGIKETYGDKRRTKIEDSFTSLTDQDLIPDEEVVVTLTQKGYIKRVPLETYGVQHRGGKGKMGMHDLDDNEDVVRDMFVTKNLDELLFFTNLGRVYSLQVYEIGEASRTAKGRAVINLLPLTEGEHVVKLLCMRGMEGKNIVMVTKKGIIKKTDAMSFAKIRVSGIRALGLKDNDQLAFCGVSSGKDFIVLATAYGQGIRFKEDEVRQMGRQAEGVIGIRMRDDDYVVGMEIIDDETKTLLFATSKGYGKQTQVVDFRVAHRGGLGVRTIPTDHRNGVVIGLVIIGPLSHILLIDDAGKIIHLVPTEIRTMGRQAKGVRLIRLDDGRKLSSIKAFDSENNDKQDGSSSSGLPPTEDDGGDVDDDTSTPENSETSEPIVEEVVPAKTKKASTSKMDQEDDVISARQEFEDARADEPVISSGHDSFEAQAAFDEIMAEDMILVKGPDDFQTMIF